MIGLSGKSEPRWMYREEFDLEKLRSLQILSRPDLEELHSIQFRNELFQSSFSDRV